MAPRFLIPVLGVLSVALAAALVVMLVDSGGDDLSLSPGEPEIASTDQLADLAADSDTKPLYWLGERDGSEYEVTETAGGRFYLRYLEDGAEAGDERPDFLAVGTYPSKDGVGELRKAVKTIDGAVLARTDDGAVVLIDPGSAKSAHLAYPGGDSQIEIYSPVPGQALRIARRGELQPIQ